MKKIFIYSICVIQCCYLASCYKDLGNYHYNAINTISFAGIDTVNGYSAVLGDTLSITPNLTASLDPNNQHKYTYQWSFYDAINGDQVISTDKDLKYKVAKTPGLYTLQYRVTDSSTSVLFHIKTTLLVTTDIYEGYMVLNDVNGNSRLDMLSYDVVANKFTQYTDVLTQKGSSLPPQGQPYKVLCTRVSTAFNYSDSTYGIYLLTASGTNRINPETFDYQPTYNIRYEVVDNIPQDFKADNMVADPSTYFISIYLVSDGNIYTRNGSVPLYILPINKYVGQAPFKASPYVVSDGEGNAVFFNMDNRSFAVTNSLNSLTVSDPPAPTGSERAFPKGQDLLYMDKSRGGYAYAVTKTPGASDCYLTRFMPGSNPDYSQQITGTDIDKATQFAVSSNPEYLFYSVGGKVYEYDLSLATSKLMLDKGASQISYLAIQRFSDLAPIFGGPPTADQTIYNQWVKWLTVGSYDPAGPAGANGTLEQYQVVDANDPLVLQKSWTGFGKITSVSYRER